MDISPNCHIGESFLKTYTVKKQNGKTQLLVYCTVN